MRCNSEDLAASDSQVEFVLPIQRIRNDVPKVVDTHKLHDAWFPGLIVSLTERKLWGLVRARSLILSGDRYILRLRAA